MTRPFNLGRSVHSDLNIWFLEPDIPSAHINGGVGVLDLQAVWNALRLFRSRSPRTFRPGDFGHHFGGGLPEQSGGNTIEVVGRSRSTSSSVVLDARHHSPGCSPGGRSTSTRTGCPALICSLAETASSQSSGPWTGTSPPGCFLRWGTPVIDLFANDPVHQGVSLLQSVTRRNRDRS